VVVSQVVHGHFNDSGRALRSSRLEQHVYIDIATVLDHTHTHIYIYIYIVFVAVGNTADTA